MVFPAEPGDVAYSGRDGNDTLGLLGRLSSGDVVGPFVVDGFHAEGGWSDVYRAHHRDRDLGPVALKVMPVALARRVPPKLSGIAHLVEVFEAGTCAARGCAWVAMRFVAGHGLDRVLLASAGPPAAESRRLLVERVAEVASALSALHACGITHCDVKPGNILVEGAADGAVGSAVLVDLGFARTAPTTAMATVYATLPYAAPEQILGLDVDGRADVFALGLCLHDLVSGRPPCRREVRPAAGMEPLQRVVPGIDADLAAIVAEAVAPARERRYADAAAFAADLRCWLAGAPPAVRPRSLWRRAGRCREREPGQFYRRCSMALVALILVVGVVAAIRVAARQVRVGDEFATALESGGLERALQLSREHGLSAASPRVAARSSRDGVDAARQVLQHLIVEDRAAARMLAARLVARDGVERQAPVVRWLLSQSALATDAGSAAAVCLSHALYDQPVAQWSETVAWLRDGLFELLRTAGDEAALHVLSACGGVVAPGDLDALVTIWFEQLGRRRVRTELLRLGLEVCGRISWRSLVQGARAADLMAIEANLGRVAAWIGAQPDHVEWRSTAPGDLLAWQLAIRRARDALGQAPPLLLQLPWPPTLAQQAIAKDTKGVLAAAAAAGRDEPFQSGLAFGLMANAAQWADPLATSGSAAEWTAARAAQYRTGWQQGQLLLGEANRPYAVQPGALLADGFGAAPPPFQDIPVHALPAASRPLASWDFTTKPATGTGAIGSAAMRQCTGGLDEVEPGSHYLCLGQAGVSALRFVFREPEVVCGAVDLVLSLQKGRRGALPYCGEAGLGVRFDDRLLATVRDLGSASAIEVRVPIGPLTVGRLRCIAVELLAGANTTVRVFGARIE